MRYLTIPEELYDLELTLKETICLAIIYGFCQGDQGVFTGSKSHIAKLLRCSKRTADETVESLVSRGFVIRVDDGLKNGADRMSYKVSEPVQNLHPCRICTGAKSAPNNAILLDIVSKDTLSRNIANNNTLNAHTRARLSLPYDSEEFKITWAKLIRQPKWKKKTVECLEGNLKTLEKLGNEQDAIAVMEYSINGNYQGLFPEKAPTALRPRMMSKGDAQWAQIQRTLDENPYK